MLRFGRGMTIAVLTAALVALGGTARAVPVDLDTTVGTGADSYVRKGNPNDNFGSGNTILVKDAGGSSTTRKGYVALDLSGVTGTLTDATLTLDVTTNNQGGGNPDPKEFTVEVLGLRDGHPGEGWDEGTITFNNAPANGPNNVVTGDALRLGTVAIPALSTSTVTFSDTALRSFLNMDSDDRATVILRRQGGGNGPNLGFASKERAGFNPPTLTGQAEAGAPLLITTGDGNGADTYVRKGGGQANTNFGGGSQMIIKDAGGSAYTRKAYTRFDLSPVNLPILDAALLLDVTTNDQGGGGSTPQTQTVNVWGLADGDPDEAWDEMGIVWGDAPANDTSGEGILANADLLGEFVVRDVADQMALFSSQELVDFLNADTDGLATLILTRETPSGSWNLGFATAENDAFMAPTLRLEVMIPEPATLSLLALGGLLALRRRRGPQRI